MNAEGAKVLAEALAKGPWAQPVEVDWHGLKAGAARALAPWLATGWKTWFQEEVKVNLVTVVPGHSEPPQ